MSAAPLEPKTRKTGDIPEIAAGCMKSPHKRRRDYDARSGYPYVTTQATNNGVKGFCDSWTEAVGEGGVLTIDSAVAGYCAWQNRPFSASDHVEKLTPKFPMNECVAMFLTAVINIEQYRYNYGRKCSQTRLRKARIRLPAAPGGAPDWGFMERCVKSLPYSANLRREAE